MWFAQTTDPTLFVTTTDVTVEPVSAGFWAAFGVYMAVVFVLWVLLIIANWKIFTKAGEAGWKSIVPFYSSYILFRIAGRNGWWFLALFVPILQIVALVILAVDLAKHFGKSTVFGVVALLIFSVVGYLMLGFGKAEYVGQKHA